MKAVILFKRKLQALYRKTGTIGTDLYLADLL